MNLIISLFFLKLKQIDITSYIQDLNRHYSGYKALIHDIYLIKIAYRFGVQQNRKVTFLPNETSCDLQIDSYIIDVKTIFQDTTTDLKIKGFPNQITDINPCEIFELLDKKIKDLENKGFDKQNADILIIVPIFSFAKYLFGSNLEIIRQKKGLPYIITTFQKQKRQKIIFFEASGDQFYGDNYEEFKYMKSSFPKITFSTLPPPNS